MEAAFAGEFLKDEAEIAEKLDRVKLWLFDWDGVFHNGQKSATGESSFNEIDAMGLNLLRFAHYLKTGRLPYFVIVTGVHNPTGEAFAIREHFDAIFMGAKNKEIVLQHICKEHRLDPSEVAFAFDDILDVNVAKQVGVRFYLSHGAKPITSDFLRSQEIFDYATAFSGGYGGLREVSELVMTLLGNADDVLEERIAWSENYDNYWDQRQAKLTKIFEVDKAGVHLRGQV